MNKLKLALPLALISAFSTTSAFANTGTIRFEGNITAGACPIEIINPNDGSSGNVVKMGPTPAAQFTAVGQELAERHFTLRFPGGANCGAGDTANVRFDGAADTSGDYFAVTPSADGATGVSLSLRDHRNTSIKPGGSSADYDLNDSGATDLRFMAYYRSTVASVSPGRASADIQFTVDLK